MEAPISAMKTGVDDVYERRGGGYPTRSDSIGTTEDRQDWLTVARDIITKSGTKPGQVRRLAAMSGTDMMTVINGYVAKKPQHSLKSILIRIINSSRHEWTNTPTVEEYRRLFEEMNPEPPSPALLARGLQPRIISQPIVIPRHGHTGGLRTYTRGRVVGVLISPEYIQPGGRYDVSHFETLTPTQKKVFRILGGYHSGPENAVQSYTPDSTITAAKIAEILGDTNKNAVSTLLWQIRGKIADIHAARSMSEPVGEVETPGEQIFPTPAHAFILPKRNDLSIFPAHLIQYIGVLSAVQRADFHAFYGFKGHPNGSASPSSYDEKRRKPYEEIAQNRNVGKGAVHVSISTGYKRLQQCAMAAQESTKTTTTQIRQGSKPAKYTPDKLPNLAGILDLFPYLRSVIFAWYGYDGEGDPTDPQSYSVSRAKTHQQIVDETGVPLARVQTYLCIARGKLGWPPEEDRAHAPTEETTLLERFVEQEGEKKVGVLPRRGAVVIAPPKSVSPSVSDILSFEELVASSTECRIVQRAPVSRPQPAPLQKPRTIPTTFPSYRDALIWAKEQKDWIEAIGVWLQKTPPVYQDDLGIISWLRQDGAPSGLLPFLNTIRQIQQEPHLKYKKILEAILGELPEEEFDVEDIQKNPAWMEILGRVFEKHEKKDYAGFMAGLTEIYSDENERLAIILDALTRKYEAPDVRYTLALVLDKNWTDADLAHYARRTLRDVFVYRSGTNAELDRVLEIGTHVKAKKLQQALQNVTLRIPCNKEHWPRHEEYSCPEITLYDIVLDRVKREGGDSSSSKVVFHALEHLICAK